MDAKKSKVAAGKKLAKGKAKPKKKVDAKKKGKKAGKGEIEEEEEIQEVPALDIPFDEHQIILTETKELMEAKSTCIAVEFKF